MIGCCCTSEAGGGLIVPAGAELEHGGPWGSGVNGGEAEGGGSGESVSARGGLGRSRGRRRPGAGGGRGTGAIAGAAAAVILFADRPPQRTSVLTHTPAVFIKPPDLGRD